MKKLIAIALLLGAFQGYAQTASISIKGGFGLTNAKRAGASSSSAIKLTAGLESYLQLIKLQRGLYISIIPDIMYQPNAYETTLTNVNVNYITASLPIVLSIADGRKGDWYSMYIGAGPFLGYALSGKFTQSGGPDIDFKFGETVNDNRTRYNGGIVFKAGIKINKFSLNLEQFTGTKNIIPKDRIVGDDKLTTTGFYMTLSMDIL